MLCAVLLTAACGTPSFAMSGSITSAKQNAVSQAESEEKAADAAEGEKKDQETAETSEKEATEKEAAEKEAAAGEKEAGEKEVTAAENDTADKEAAEKETDEKGADKKEADKEGDKKENEEKETEEKETEDPEAYEKKVKKALKKKEKEKQKEAEALKKFDEEIAGDYVPEGFSPYGDYLLVYDYGYPVKTRLSPAGMTFYWGSEEFFFRLTKDLPDMTKNVAHLLFNTQAPMVDPGEETFPFAEGYVLQISLDNGSYYEVYSSQLDKHGRIFVRDLFESFREKWDGAF